MYSVVTLKDLTLPLTTIVGKRTLGIGIKIFKPSDKSTADHGKSTWPAVFLVK